MIFIYIKPNVMRKVACLKFLGQGTRYSYVNFSSFGISIFLHFLPYICSNYTVVHNFLNPIYRCLNKKIKTENIYKYLHHYISLSTAKDFQIYLTHKSF